MARFPYHKKNVSALGKLLAEAAVNPDLRAALQNNPAEELRKIGLPKQTVSLFNFRVVEETADKKAITIPYRINAEKVKQSDPSYLSALGEIVSGARAH